MKNEFLECKRNIELPLLSILEDIIDSYANIIAINIPKNLKLLPKPVFNFILEKEDMIFEKGGQ